MANKIKVNIFDDMNEALKDAAAYERGDLVNLRVTRIPSRPKPISAKEVRHIPGAPHVAFTCGAFEVFHTFPQP
jgi:hypothetical protein